MIKNIFFGIGVFIVLGTIGHADYSDAVGMYYPLESINTRLLIGFLLMLPLMGCDFLASEKNFENRLKKWLESKGIYALGTPANKRVVKPIGYYEKRWGGGFSKSGLPDMHICILGHSYEVELKAPNGKPSMLQIQCIKQINESGGEGLILYPKDYEQFKNLLEMEIKRWKPLKKKLLTY